LKVVGASEGVPAPTVYMNTSATPASGNPNPEAGLVLITFASGFTGYVGGYPGFASPVGGSSIPVTTGVVAGKAYIITSVGTTTQAQWVALGLNPLVTAVAGASFVAPATSTSTGTGTIQLPGTSGIDHVEVVGDPNQALAVGQVILQCLLGTALTAPADGTVIGLRFVFDAAFSEV
jgi:hypothetical protein